MERQSRMEFATFGSASSDWLPAARLLVKAATPESSKVPVALPRVGFGRLSTVTAMSRPAFARAAWRRFAKLDGVAAEKADNRSALVRPPEDTVTV